MISLILNTCALGQAGSLKSSKGLGRPYADRERMIEDTILPWARIDPNIGEIIVVGEYREGDGYVYIPCRGPDENVWDQLLQKHMGWSAAHGEIGLFLCDDHIPAFDFTKRLNHVWRPNTLWDVLSPFRIDRHGRAINPGWNDGYVHAHAIVLTRNALQRCPWENVYRLCRGTWALDVPMTDLWHRMGLRVQTAYDLIVQDIEDNPVEAG